MFIGDFVDKVRLFLLLFLTELQQARRPLQQWRRGCRSCCAYWGRFQRLLLLRNYRSSLSLAKGPMDGIPTDFGNEIVNALRYRWFQDLQEETVFPSWRTFRLATQEGLDGTSGDKLWCLCVKGNLPTQRLVCFATGLEFSIADSAR